MLQGVARHSWTKLWLTWSSAGFETLDYRPPDVPFNQSFSPLLPYLSKLCQSGLLLLFPCFFHSCFNLSAPILLSSLSLQNPALKLYFRMCQWGVHLATSSLLSSDFFRLTLYPQKGVALLWHSFLMTYPSAALTSYLLSSLLES